MLPPAEQKGSLLAATKGSLFSNSIFNKTGSSLFGSKDKQETEEKSGSLLPPSDNKSSLLTGTQSSLFSNPYFSKDGPSLFNFSLGSNNTSKGSLFGNIQGGSGLFKKTEDKSEEGDEGEEDIFKPSTSPSYDPEKAKVPEEVRVFNQKFNKHIDVFKVYNMEEKKMKNKGSGFLSLELKEEGEKIAIVVFRNSLGKELARGLLHKKFSTLAESTINLKKQLGLTLLDSTQGDLKLFRCFAVFTKEDDFEEFKRKYNETMAKI